MKRNWIKIKNEYITTDISLRKLARKYNVSFNTVRCRAKKGLWFHEKKQIQHKCITKASQKIDEKIEKFTEELTDKILLKHYKISDKLIEILEQSSDEAKKYVDKIRIGTGQGEFTEELKVFELEAVNESKLNILVSALDKLQKMQRQTLKIIDAKDEKKIEIDCKKLDNKFIPKNLHSLSYIVLP